jgi:hypothetical protein
MLRVLMLCSPRRSRHLARIVTRTPHTASIREAPDGDTELRELRGYTGMRLADLLSRSWRELGLLLSLSSFQLGCGLLSDLTQGSDDVRANVPLVLEQHRCCVLHRGELARIGVL